MPELLAEAVAIETNVRDCSPRQLCDLLTCTDTGPNNCQHVIPRCRDLIVTFAEIRLMS